eukprot:3578485-Pyramimonas_sp.AAC.1
MEHSSFSPCPTTARLAITRSGPLVRDALTDRSRPAPVAMRSRRLGIRFVLKEQSLVRKSCKFVRDRRSLTPAGGRWVTP